MFDHDSPPIPEIHDGKSLDDAHTFFRNSSNFKREMAFAELPVLQGIEFIQALPSLEGCPPLISLPLLYDTTRWPAATKDITDKFLQQRVLDYAPRACGG
jgi:hypothetical protein